MEELTYQLDARIERHLWSDEVFIYLRARYDNNRIAYVSNLTMKMSEEGKLPDYEPLRFSIEGAQRLMDELWNCGLRPSEGTGSAGAMRQAEDHLATLKKDNDRLHELVAIMIKKGANHE